MAKSIGDIMKGNELKTLKGSALAKYGHLDDEKLKTFGYVRDKPQPKPQEKELSEEEKAYWYNLGVERYYNFTFDEKWQFLCRLLNKTTDSGKWDWKFNEHNNKIIRDVFLYFNGDKKSSLDLSKGIIMLGPTGTGKTSLMDSYLSIPYQKTNVRKFVLNQVNRESCVEMLEQFNLYCKVNSQAQLFHSKYLIGSWHFGDLGSEDIAIYAKANSSPLMTTIIESRYDRKIKGKLFFTTNLNREMIKEIYGARVYSRILHMCNEVKLLGDDWRTK